jgi:hypothetical protein
MLTLLLPDYCLVFPSAHVSILFTLRMLLVNRVIMFSKGKRYGLVYVDKREIEANSTADKETAFWNVISPAFLDLSTKIGHVT